jgi:hypothetical protein
MEGRDDEETGVQGRGVQGMGVKWRGKEEADILLGGTVRTKVGTFPIFETFE